MGETSSIQCRECGYPLGSGERLMGLCPRCLLARIVDVRREVQGQLRRVRPWPDAPDPAALSEAMPALEVLELIGRGGMGLVYRARQKNLAREVALKILPAERASDPAVVARFVEEAKILGSLNHPNVVMALEAGRVTNWLYLVMELVPGPNLREVLSKQGRLNAPEVIALAKQLSAALGHAHSRGVVHRDIKPENILLEPGAVPGPAPVPAAGDLAGFFATGGKVRVADFGIARLMEQTELTITAPQQVVGTLDYLAPECRHGSGEAGAAADVYSVGVMLYEMLTGRRPAGNFPPPRKLAKVDARFDAVVMKALRSEARERYADGAALQRAIVHAAKGGRPWRRVLGLAAAAVILILLAIGVFSTSEGPVKEVKQPSTQILAQPAQRGPARDLRVLMPGDSVKVLWEEQWLEATVIEREGRRVKIHYQGWSETLDEWVGADRVKW